MHSLEELQIDKYTIIVRNVNTSPLVLNVTSGQKISRNIGDLDNPINQPTLIDIYKSHYPIAVKYTLFSSFQCIHLFTKITILGS